MNRKIWFDLDNFDLDVFKEKMEGVNILVGETYCLDIYKQRAYSKGGKIVGRVPFILLDLDNRNKLIELLFDRIYNNVSYSDIGRYYHDMMYEAKFYIDIRSDMI